MYTLEQLKSQFTRNIFLGLEGGPGDHGFDATKEATKSAAAETAQPDAVRLAKLGEQAQGLGNKMEAKADIFDGQTARTNVAEGETQLAQTSGVETTPDKTPSQTPPSEAERILAENAIIAAGGDVKDSAAIDQAIMSARGENPGQVREVTPEEQTEIRNTMLAEYAPELSIDGKTLQTLYKNSGMETADWNPDTARQEMKQFANEMEKFQILIEREGGKMPETPEEFQAFTEKLRGEDGQFHIPLSREEAEAQGFVFNEDGTIDMDKSPAYATFGDITPGKPYVGRNGKVNSGFSRPAGINKLNIDMENLAPGVDGLVEMIYHAEAGGDPDIIYSGCRINPPKPITQMKVSEVRAFQDKMVQSGSASSAVGACQVIRKTMDGAIRSGLLSPNELFDEAAQKKFTIGKLQERGLGEFQAGNISETQFMKKVSMEWASFPKDMSGASYYSGDGLNHARVSPNQVLTQLRTFKSATDAPAVV